MSDWTIRDADAGAEAWRHLPTHSPASWSRPERYIADEPLLDAVDTALWLGQPLLVTGEPGCGKTELANFIAWRLGLSRQIDTDADDEPVLEHALRFDTKSETRARDLFYTIDLIERFHAAHLGGGPDQLNPLNFIRFQPLGRALLYACNPGDLSARLEKWQRHPGQPRRSVVLVDEIDKAPTDVPNDLLMEIEAMRFFIPEMNRSVEAPVDMRPILIITSNTEKPLPDAFLRRCIYYHMPFPPPERLARIVANRLDDVDEDAPLLTDAIEVLQRLRGQPLRKRPATAELLGFVQALRQAGYGLRDRLQGAAQWQSIARVTLLKTREDQERPLEALSA